MNRTNALVSILLTTLLNGCTHSSPMIHNTSTDDTSSKIVDYTSSCSESDLQKHILQQLTSQAIKWDTINPYQSLADLAPLRIVLEDVRIIGVGEQTHGGHEDLIARHRLLRFIAEELGPTALVLEVGATAMVPINEYVNGAEPPGTLAALMQGMRSWPYATTEMMATIEWLRAYNSDLLPEQRIQVFGMDIQSGPTSLDRVEQFLNKISPTVAAEFEPILTDWHTTATMPNTKIPLDRFTATLTGLEQLVGYLETNRRNLLDTTEHSFYEADDAATELLQWYATYANPAHFDDRMLAWSARDQHMSENVQRIDQRLGGSHRIMIWAHNGHISSHVPFALGAFLKEAYGDAYYRLGFVSSEGRFRAVRIGSGIQVFEFPAVPPNSLEHTLHCTGLDLALIDWRMADGDLQKWLQESRPNYRIGAGFDPQRPELTLADNPMLIYDGILYIRTTTPSNQLPN